MFIVIIIIIDDDTLSFCHDPGDVRRGQWTKEWAKDIRVNDKCPHNGPLRAQTPLNHARSAPGYAGQGNLLASHWLKAPSAGFLLANTRARAAPGFTLTRSLNSELGSDFRPKYKFSLPTYHAESKFQVSVLVRNKILRCNGRR